MIFAKINPPLSLVDQTNVFSQNVTFRTGDYMSAVASPFRLGDDEVEFEVVFGSCKFNEEREVQDFDVYHREQIKLSGEIIQSWGEDDNVILTAIAAERGLSIEAVVSGSLRDVGRFF